MIGYYPAYGYPTHGYSLPMQLHGHPAYGYPTHGYPAHGPTYPAYGYPTHGSGPAVYGRGCRPPCFALLSQFRCISSPHPNKIRK